MLKITVLPFLNHIVAAFKANQLACVQAGHREGGLEGESLCPSQHVCARTWRQQRRSLFSNGYVEIALSPLTHVEEKATGCYLCTNKWEVLSKTISNTTHSNNIVMVSFYCSEWQCKFLPVWKCNVEATCFNISKKLPTSFAFQPRRIYLTHLLSHHLVNYNHFVNSIIEWRQPPSTVQLNWYEAQMGQASQRCKVPVTPLVSVETPKIPPAKETAHLHFPCQRLCYKY